jgi:hypothetical protein
MNISQLTKEQLGRKFNTIREKYDCYLSRVGEEGPSVTFVERDTGDIVKRNVSLADSVVTAFELADTEAD